MKRFFAMASDKVSSSEIIRRHFFLQGKDFLPQLRNQHRWLTSLVSASTSAVGIPLEDLDYIRMVSTPTLDGFIDQLPDLAIFHTNTNNFSSTISPKIAQLNFLYELNLSNNLLSGTFPVSVLNLPTLSFLDIRYNFFTDTIPLQIFMQNLDVLFLNNNNFMQKLPDNLGDITVLYLTLANNKFTGPIPRSIKKATSLIAVLFLSNFLTGCLPYEIRFLRKLTMFDSGNNLLAGQLPSSLGYLENVEQLNIAENLLYGQVPEVVCALGNLLNLSLSNNYFIRVRPLCKKLIKSDLVDVRRNCIYGVPDQKPVQECYRFFLQPRSCFRPSWSNIIPCKLHSWKQGYGPSVRPKRNLVSYSAFSRTRTL